MERVVVLEMEKETLAQKIENMELKTTKVKEGLEGVEKEVVSGMEKAKEEVLEISMDAPKGGDGEDSNSVDDNNDTNVGEEEENIREDDVNEKSIEDVIDVV